MVARWIVVNIGRISEISLCVKWGASYWFWLLDFANWLFKQRPAYIQGYGCSLIPASSGLLVMLLKNCFCALRPTPPPHPTTSYTNPCNPPQPPFSIQSLHPIDFNVLYPTTINPTNPGVCIMFIQLLQFTDLHVVLDIIHSYQTIVLSV